MNLYRLLLPWLPATIRAVYRMQIEGGEHVPARGAVVVVANHLSAIDPFVLGAAVPRELRYMAKAELWGTRPLAWAMDGLGGFPVDRGRGDRDALARGVALLEQGEAVGVFPGGRVRWEGPWFRGAAKLALHAGAPILPVRLFDTDRAVAGRSIGFPRVRVVIGAPIAVGRAKPTIATARDLTDRARAAVEAL
jgi:1-acyl-sn-glycerol-3-phosphate acyltransferase